MKDYDLNQLLIAEGDSHLTNPMELHYASYENFAKLFIKNYKNTARNYLIEFGAAIAFALFFYLILNNLRNIWAAFGNVATFAILFIVALEAINLNKHIKHRQKSQ